MRAVCSLDNNRPASSDDLVRKISADRRGFQLGAVLTLGLVAFLSTPVGDWSASPALASSTAGERERLTVVGTRLTQGNAVDCPTVKTDEGKVVGVSYLPPSIAIGDRISVTGFFAVTTHCVGEVLYAEDVTALGRD